MGVALVKCVGGGAPGRREVVTVLGDVRGGCGGGSGGGGGEGDEGGKGGEVEAALTVSTLLHYKRSIVELLVRFGARRAIASHAEVVQDHAVCSRASMHWWFTTCSTPSPSTRAPQQ
eukprot:scaffold6026_cov66-Phaeocystis_antarctica.AAC.1